MHVVNHQPGGYDNRMHGSHPGYPSNSIPPELACLNSLSSLSVQQDADALQSMY